MKCTYFYCNYTRSNDFTDPITPALAIPTAAQQPFPSPKDASGKDATISIDEALDYKERIPQETPPSSSTGTPTTPAPGADLDISDEAVPIPQLTAEHLPKCPQCRVGLLRPGVVWFGESLPEKTLNTIDDWLDYAPRVDLILVIGTSSKVYPAAGYVDEARDKGARVAVVNMDGDLPESGLDMGDWFFKGDAGQIVPELLKGVIGEI